MTYIRQSIEAIGSQNFEAYAEYKCQLVKYETSSKQRALNLIEIAALEKMQEEIQGLLVMLAGKKECSGQKNFS